MTTPDLQDPLDQEREASMADEGGAAGAAMESEVGDARFSSARDRSPRQSAGLRNDSTRWLLLWGAGLAIGAALFYLAGDERSFSSSKKLG